MSFRFALESLFRLRQSVERQRAIDLQNASFRAARAQERLTQLDRYLSDSAASDLRGLGEGRTAAELQFAAAYREKLLGLRQELQTEVTHLEGLRQNELGEYRRAFRDREVLESLRVRQQRIYRQEQSRRRQRELDADYLLRRWRQEG
jgi:flagellar export protein FliJ